MTIISMSITLNRKNLNLDVPFCLVAFFCFSFLAFFFSFFSIEAEGGLFATEEEKSISSILTI